MTFSKKQLKQIEVINHLIDDLYLDLRKKVNYWSEITEQTPQARMGYVGQHLVSIVTGYKGGKSGARGYDLIVPKNNHSEIKTCYRVDQLGKCLDCGKSVSAIESKCSKCQSKNIKRGNDSKWLLPIKKYSNLQKMIEPLSYYFVLFEFDKDNINEIDITIWKVDSKCYGFSLCMLDYYFNIRENSSSKAPFNMWPHQLKFFLTKPVKIYQSIIKEDNSIDTLVFNTESKEIDRVKFSAFSSATTLNLNNINTVIKKLNIPTNSHNNKLIMLENIDTWLENNNDKYEEFIDELAKSIYIPLIKSYKDKIPSNYFEIIKEEELF